MSNSIHCPDCGTLTPPDARFCPGCGRPRTFLKEQLAQESLATGETYTDLLDRARAAELTGIPLATTLARLERRLNDIESQVRELDGGRRPAPSPAPQPVAQPAPQVSRQLEAPVYQMKPKQVAAEQPRAVLDLESLITGRVLGWVGGLAVALGAAFFLSLAFSNNWIGPGLRVTIGVVASLLMIAGGAWFFERREAIFGHILVATSLGVMSLSLLAATRLYEFIDPQIGVLSALAVAALAATIAIRANSQAVAAFGLVAVLISPPLVGADPSYLTLAFVGVALAGTVAVALYRQWRWLPPLAFLLSAPQAADYLSGAEPAGVALLVLTGFWALYVLASGGEEFRRSTDRLSVPSTTVMIVNALFLAGIGFEVLSGSLESWRGLFLVGAAFGNGLFGGYFLYVRHERHPFGMLATGIGVAALALAVPVQFGGPLVPMLWAALATALAWVYARRNHEYSGALACVLGLLAIVHLFQFEYPVESLPEGINSAWPYFNQAGGTLAFMLTALAVSWYMISQPLVRSLLVIAAGALIALSAPFELPPAAAVAVWAATAAALWTLTLYQHDVAQQYRLAASAIVATGTLWTLAGIAPPGRLFIEMGSPVDHPLFWSSASAALLALIGAFTIGFYVQQQSREGHALAVLAAATSVYLLSIGLADEFQSRVGGVMSLESLQKQSQVGLSILWASLGVLAFVIGLVKLGVLARSFGLALLALATLKVFIYDLASLDASYRVLSFIGLGVILLASSYAYQHFMPLFERQPGPGSPLEEPPG